MYSQRSKSASNLGLPAATVIQEETTARSLSVQPASTARSLSVQPASAENPPGVHVVSSTCNVPGRGRTTVTSGQGGSEAGSLNDGGYATQSVTKSRVSYLRAATREDLSLNRKQVQELLTENLKLVISNVDEYIMGFERKLEAVVEQRLIPFSNKIDESVMMLEGRIEGIMRTGMDETPRLGLLGEQTHNPAPFAHLLKGSPRETASIEHLDMSFQTLPPDIMLSEVDPVAAHVQIEMDDARQSQIDMISHDMEKNTQALQAELSELRDRLLQVELHGTSHHFQGEAVLLAPALDDLKQRMEELQAQSDEMKSNISTHCSPSASGFDMPGSMSFQSASVAPEMLNSTTELESRLDKMETRLSVFTEQQVVEAQNFKFQAHLDKMEARLNAVTEQQAVEPRSLPLKETSQLMDEIVRVERMYAQLEAASLEARNETSQLQTHAQQLQAQVRTLEAQIEGLSAKLARKPAEHEAGVQKLEAQVMTLEVQLERLRAQPAVTSSNSESLMQQLQSQLKFLEAQVQDLRVQPKGMTITQERSFQQLQLQVKTLETRVEGLHAQPTETKENKEEHVQQLQARFMKLEAQVEGLRAEPALVPADKDSQAIRALDKEVQTLRSECARMTSLIENASQDFSWCRRNTDTLLEDIKSLVERSETSTAAASIRLDDANSESAATTQSDAQSKGKEFKQWRQALGDLQERLQSPKASAAEEASGQALSSLQNVIQQLVGRVDCLVESEAVRRRSEQSDQTAMAMRGRYSFRQSESATSRAARSIASSPTTQTRSVSPPPQRMPAASFAAFQASGSMTAPTRFPVAGFDPFHSSGWRSDDSVASQLTAPQSPTRLHASGSFPGSSTSRRTDELMAAPKSGAFPAYTHFSGSGSLSASSQRPDESLMSLKRSSTPATPLLGFDPMSSSRIQADELTTQQMAVTQREGLHRMSPYQTTMGTPQASLTSREIMHPYSSGIGTPQSLLPNREVMNLQSHSGGAPFHVPKSMIRVIAPSADGGSTSQTSHPSCATTPSSSKYVDPIFRI